MTQTFRKKCLHCEGRVTKADYSSGTCRHCGKSFAALEKREAARLRKVAAYAEEYAVEHADEIKAKAKEEEAKAKAKAKEEEAKAKTKVAKQKSDQERAKFEEIKDAKIAEWKEQAKVLNIYANISAYRIVSGDGAYALEKRVKEAMIMGWKPLGSMSVYHPGGRIGSVPDHFFQTMVKFQY